MGKFDPDQIHPDKTYEVTLDREGWPVREIDSGTGEIVTFDRGPGEGLRPDPDVPSPTLDATRGSRTHSLHG